MYTSKSNTLLCIDGFANAEIEGRIYNRLRPQKIVFFGVFALIAELEKLFDELSFPQATFSYRTFRAAAPQTDCQKSKEAEPLMEEDVFQAERGKKSTFIVDVQFRQNATWQGTIRWIDQKKTQRFRSTLEMIKLMDDALTEQQAQQFAGWQDLPTEDETAQTTTKKEEASK